MEKFREEMNKNGQQAIGSNLKKFNLMWTVEPADVQG
jgi:hypothetical protein